MYGFNPPAGYFPAYSALSNASRFSQGGFSQASASALSRFGLAVSLAQAFNSPLGSAARSGALSLGPNGLNLAAAFATNPQNGLPSAGSIARHFSQNGQLEAISRANPLSQESLAAVRGSNFLALGYANNSPLGSRSRALALTPFGIVVSGASTGIFGNENFKRLV